MRRDWSGLLLGLEGVWLSREDFRGVDLVGFEGESVDLVDDLEGESALSSWSSLGWKRLAIKKPPDLGALLRDTVRLLVSSLSFPLRLPASLLLAQEAYFPESA